MILPVLQIPHPLLKARAHLIEAETHGLQPDVRAVIDAHATEIGQLKQAMIELAQSIKPGGLSAAL